MNRKRNILVVDDNEQNRYMLKVLLEGHGFQPILANGGSEALDLAKSNPPDLIISDILMPGLDGFSLCRQWKSDDRLKDIPFIFYTATYTDLKDEELSLSLGAARFIRKPEEPGKFISIIQEVLDEYQRGELVEPHKPLEKEEIFYKKYNKVLIQKMEDKLLELEQANKDLSKLFEKSKELTYRIETGLRAGNLAWWEMDIPSRKITFDDRKVELIGFSPEMFNTFEDFNAILHPDDLPIVRQAMVDHLDGKKETYEVEYRLKTSSGTYKWFRDFGAITERDDQAGKLRVVGITEDITNRKEAEIELEKYSNHLETLVAERTKELEKAQNDLIAKEKLATLGQLAGSVGHELRNPLGVINNAVYILRSHLTPENATAKEYLDMIAAQVQRSSKIISDLLNFAREPIVDKSITDVSELMKLSIVHCPPPENITIESCSSQNIPKVYVDENQIEQVIVNILSNAYQAMPNGGKVQVSYIEKGKYIHLSITDSGLGISAKDQKKLFTPLFSTKTTGIGLGLAVSKKFIEANGGKITVKSKPGQGSTFTIIIPSAG